MVAKLVSVGTPSECWPGQAEQQGRAAHPGLRKAHPALLADTGCVATRCSSHSRARAEAWGSRRSDRRTSSTRHGEAKSKRADRRYAKSRCSPLSSTGSPEDVQMVTDCTTSARLRARAARGARRCATRGRRRCREAPRAAHQAPCAPAFMNAAPPTVPGMPTANSRPPTPSPERRAARTFRGVPPPATTVTSSAASPGRRRRAA